MQLSISSSPAKQERLEELNSQLWNAGLIGMLRGSIIGVVTGYYFMHRYNRGVNKRFFQTPYKFLYLVSWNIVGIIFTTDVATMKMSRQVAMEEDLKRSLYYQQELQQLEKSKEK